MKNYLLIVVLCTMLICPKTPQSPGWRGIIPLHSTREDVEKLFGKPNVGESSYDIDGQRITFLYTREPCRSTEWNVPRDTVFSIITVPPKRTTYEKLEIDKSGFEHHQDPELKWVETYVNELTGVVVEVNNGIVSTISYEAAKEDEHLMCKSL